ncbi:O-methyltransferase [Nonomuraea sp. NPDC059023]|uniref:O-methyltransferase n=1 Tax=unclassified Nonomuraea TaxID=2593643 RepID=UPI00367C5130
MRNTLAEPRVADALDRMFAAAAGDDTIAARVDSFGNTPQEHADAAEEIYMPISPEAGRLLYSLVRAIRPATVVEFGMSFGISTLHLAAAVRDNGTGRVITTELSAHKIAAARRTFAETGLAEVITVLEGDALRTLADLPDKPGFVLLDGWKDLYLPVLRMLEPRLDPGTLVVADDVELESVQPYLAYVREPGNGYACVTFPVEDGLEISCRL